MASNRAVAADHTTIFQMSDAAGAGGRRQPDLLGQLDLAGAGVGDELGQDSLVDAVEPIHAVFLQ